MNTTLYTSARLPLKYCQKRVCYLKFSYVLLIKKCSSLHQNNSHHSGGAWLSWELRKSSDAELKFLTIKSLHQKQSLGMFYKKCSQNFVKLTVEKPGRTRTQMLFSQFCKIFKNTFFTEHLRWLLLPILKPLDSQR